MKIFKSPWLGRQFLFFTLFISAFIPNGVEAARLYFSPALERTGVGSSFSVRVLVNSSDEKINAVGASVVYPNKILRLIDWSDGGSAISFWVQRPSVKDGSITFQGIIPGGYRSPNGLVLVLNFETIKEGAGSLAFATSSEILLNDGKGTSVPVERGVLKVRVEGAGQDSIDKPKDAVPPEDFLPVVSRDSNLFSGKYFLVFSTTDKGSGIERYEFSEDVGIFAPEPEHWSTAESPVELRDQELRSWISVKAIDREGNERIVTLKPGNIPFYRHPLFIILAITIALFVLLLITKRHHAKRKKN